jgi:peptide/nickel transport system substrate-binding protein
MALMLATCALFCACSKVSTQVQPGTSGHAWTHHGVLRIGEIFDPSTLNTELTTEQTTVDLSMFWAGYLFNWSDDDRWVPELATEVPTTENGGISKDGLRITYHLRPGVKWQDGAPFGADDVIFTWHAVMNPNNNVGSRLGYDIISRIDKIDDHTITVHILRPYAPFVATFFTMSSTPYAILPAHLLASLPDINRAAYNNLPIGTGPFKLVEWHKGSLIKFVANPGYWRGPPKLQTIEYHIIPSDDTILTQLRTHEIDMEYAASQSQLPSLRGIEGTRVILNPFTAFAMLAYNLSGPILHDVRVRRALAYATDRDTIINKAAHGVPVANETDQPNFLWAYNPDTMKYPYNPARASALLDSAGWKLGPDGYRYKEGKRLALVAAGTAGSAIDEIVFGVLQQNWKAAGIDVAEKPYSPMIITANYAAGGILQTGKFDVAFFSWINGVDPDDSAFTMCDQWPPNGQNVYHYCNPTLDAAERTALSVYGQSERKKKYDQIQEMLVADQPFLVIWFNRRVNVVSTDLTGFKPAHAVTEFWNTWEWSI